MAALELREAGRKVVVLEARERVGGRARTVRFGERIANAGAEWVNTEHRLVRELCAAYRVPLVPAGGFMACVVDGRLEEAPPESLDAVEAALDAMVGGLANPERPWRDPEALRLDRHSVADWLDEVDPPADARAWSEAHVRCEYMVEPEELSLASLAVLTALGSSDQALRLRDGTAALLEAMARDLGGEDVVRLGEPVVRVAQGPEGVTVETTRGVYRAGDAVVALPLPALGRVSFEPAIGAPSLGYGCGGKLLVPYSERAWDRGPSGERMETGIDLVYESAPHRPGPGGVLVAYGTKVVSEAEVRRAFRTWFPGLPEPDAAPTEAWWGLEAENGGTYSALRPGDLPALERLRRPFGRVRLAGEHTEAASGYLESALRSGRRVATQLLSEDS